MPVAVDGLQVTDGLVWILPFLGSCWAQGGGGRGLVDVLVSLINAGGLFYFVSCRIQPAD